MMIYGVNLDSIAGTLHDPRLAPLIPRTFFADNSDLDESAGTDSGYGILIIVREVEMSREPEFDLRIIFDGSYEDVAIGGAVVEPCAAVGYVYSL